MAMITKATNFLQMDGLTMRVTKQKQNNKKLQEKPQKGH